MRLSKPFRVYVLSSSPHDNVESSGAKMENEMETNTVCIRFLLMKRSLVAPAPKLGPYMIVMGPNIGVRVTKVF